MDRRPTPVKRPYDGSARRAQAERTARTIVAAARELFLAEGYAGTTVPRVAAECGVSPESVYKRFGGKPGLVRAVVEDALQGSGEVPAEARSDALAADDPFALVRAWGRLTAEVMPGVAPVLLLVRLGAAQDLELAQLADDLDRSRRVRMGRNARRLRGHLRPGVTVARATDVLWTYSAPELYDLVVVRSGWSVSSYARLVVDGLIGSLLGPAAGSRGP